MSNKNGFIAFREITSGSFAFIWHTIVGGYKLLDETTNNVIDGTTIIDSNDHWLVGAVEEPYTERVYTPLAKPILHREFAKLFSDESIIKFANNYGMLGQTKLVAPCGGGPVSHAESLALWKNKAWIWANSCQFGIWLHGKMPVNWVNWSNGRVIKEF